MKGFMTVVLLGFTGKRGEIVDAWHFTKSTGERQAVDYMQSRYPDKKVVVIRKA